MYERTTFFQKEMGEHEFFTNTPERQKSFYFPNENVSTQCYSVHLQSFIASFWEWVFRLKAFLCDLRITRRESMPEVQNKGIGGPTIKIWKSSCVTARGVPPAVYPVHGVCCPGGRGVPLTKDLSGVPSLHPGWGGGPPPPRPRTWLGYPLPLWERNWETRAPPPPRKDLGPEAGKGPGTRLGSPPPPPVNRQTSWKHYLPVVLRTRAVKSLSYYHPRMRTGNNFSQVCLCTCVSVCLGYNFWTSKVRNFTFGMQIHLDHI